MISNTDNRAVTPWASYDGLVWAKFIDEDCLDQKAENDNILMRLADVLLMYAEAKIELGEIDESVLNAMNQVRARAYGVSVNQTTDYPEITGDSQTELRKALRIERRMEFAMENVIRYNDIIRWRLAEKVLNNPRYGMLNPPELKERVVDKGLWFFAETPPIDEDGVVDFQPLYEQGFIRLLRDRNFDPTKHYLWPIPSSEILINENMTQNPGY
jgi:starch-binding outer membrane protein, SusD/RagB family